MDMKNEFRASRACTYAWLALSGLFWTAPAVAAPSITFDAGVSNPAPTIESNLDQLGRPDAPTLVPVATFAPLLQATLDAQGFTAINNWSLITNQLTLANNATFNITAYGLSLNVNPTPSFPIVGTGFGETMDFTLNPNLAGPQLPPDSIATVTEHWLQILNEDKQYGGFGFALAGQPGFWQLDNGDFPGGVADGADTGPYYDSNPIPGKTFSTPPSFHDFPSFYAGPGTFLHFETMPVWDIFTPPAGDTPASEQIVVSDFALAWGFIVTPEPAPLAIFAIGLLLLGLRRAAQNGSALRVAADRSRGLGASSRRQAHSP